MRERSEQSLRHDDVQIQNWTPNNDDDDFKLNPTPRSHLNINSCTKRQQTVVTFVSVL